MNKPAITVYVLSHNYAHYLAQAVESVFAQSRTDWELIIIDDGSTDRTAEVAREHGADHGVGGGELDLGRATREDRDAGRRLALGRDR